MNTYQITQVVNNISREIESVIGSEKLIDVGILIRGSWITKYGIRSIFEEEDHIYVIVNVYTENARYGKFYFFNKETCEMIR